MLLQELCLNKCEWDSLIPQPGRNRLQKWLTDLEKVSEMTVSRYYFPKKKEEWSSQPYTDTEMFRREHIAQLSTCALKLKMATKQAS